MSESHTLEGTLDRIVWSANDGSWSVVRLETEKHGGPVTAVGNLLGVRPGETLRLSGEWEQDKKYGRQFRVQSYHPVEPKTEDGIKKFLGSGLIPGIGPKMAERLVDAFGHETLDVIENHPDRLARVPGIGPKRRREIRQAWTDQRHLKDLMVFLQSHGVSGGQVGRIHKAYGERALGLVREDPYRLARDVRGIGFLSADRIAASMGMPQDAPTRLQAGVVHVLDEASGKDGHLFLPRRELVHRATELLGVTDEALVDRAVDALAKDEAVRLEVLPESVARSIGGGPPEDQAVYWTPLWAAEVGVADRLRALLDSPAKPLDLDVAKALAWFEGRRDFELAPEQRRAVELGLTEKALVITGGPGTGKTTLIQAVVEILFKKGVKMLLAAPTGRAAKRLSEATGMDARTIHRLLEYNPVARGFERDADRPLTADLVILDEVSMLDAPLAHQTLKAVADSSRLILVGDVDQLPSVGPGQVLADLIDSGALPVVRLQTIFRQAQRSLIVDSAHRVNRGELPVPVQGPETTRPDDDFFFIDRDDPEKALATVLEVVTRRIPGTFGLDPLRDIQVLTPMNRGLLGTETLNERLQEALNPAAPDKPEFRRGHRLLRQGDKIMQVRNNYDLGVFNGDVGTLERIDLEDDRVVCRFDDLRVVHEKSSLDELVPAYACSIHKSQGSEYPCVVLPFHTQHWVMLQRNLLYTAITRGRRLVVLVGERKAVAKAVRQGRHRRRWSLLAHRLQ